MEQPQHRELQHACPVPAHGIPLLVESLCINAISLADISVRYIDCSGASIRNRFESGNRPFI
jgi:hypothetical protein